MPAAVSTLLSNDQLARLERWRLDFSHRFTNREKGGHISRKGGASTEFADFRDYAAGDDLRLLDWNIFARLRRPYVKLFHHEEVSHLLLIVDASASMLSEKKGVLARQATAALALLALRGAERVTLAITHQNSGEARTLGPLQGQINMAKALRFLESSSGDGHGVALEAALESIATQHRGRGIAVILSDFFTMGDPSRALNRLFGGGMEIYALQIFAPSEWDPIMDSDARLQDWETDETLDISVTPALLQAYRERRDLCVADVREKCQRRGGDSVITLSNMTAEHLVFDLLARRGWIRRK